MRRVRDPNGDPHVGGIWGFQANDLAPGPKPILEVAANVGAVSVRGADRRDMLAASGAPGSRLAQQLPLPNASALDIGQL